MKQGQDFVHNGRYRTGLIEIDHIVLAGCHEPGNLRCCATQFFIIINGKRNLCFMGNSQDMHDEISRAADSHAEADGIFNDNVAGA